MGTPIVDATAWQVLRVRTGDAMKIGDIVACALGGEECIVLDVGHHYGPGMLRVRRVRDGAVYGIRDPSQQPRDAADLDWSQLIEEADT